MKIHIKANICENLISIFIFLVAHSLKVCIPLQNLNTKTQMNHKEYGKNEKKFWYPLDNAAKIFPAITTRKVTSVFRITVVLKSVVHIKSLFQAVRDVENRFPYFKVKMRKGFFWYYLESDDFKVPVVQDKGEPCRRFTKRGHMYRVLVAENRISVEFSHILTDGTGAFEFLKAILARYIEIRDVDIPPDFAYMKAGEIPDSEEFEDAYNRYFDPEVPASVKRPKAFHLPFKLASVPRYDVLSATMKSEQLKKIAKENGVSITVYLASVYLKALQDIFEETGGTGRHSKAQKLCVEIPVNLRKIYPTKTMRNFSLFVMPEIDRSLGHYTFEEILKTVYHQMQLETDAKLVNKILARHVGSERKFIIRAIPLFVKSLFLRLSYYSLGSSQYSGVVTNFGHVPFPGEITEHIDCLTFMPPPPNKLIKVSCGVVSAGNKLVMSFGNITETKELERRIIKYLVNEGVDIKLSSYCNKQDA
jgi:NRPS condensation-like uncharacterized protein